MFCKNHKSLVLSVLTILASITIYNIYGASNAFAATASMSTTGSVNIDVSASGNSANIGTDTLTVNTTCSTGYTVTIQSSVNDTTLYKDGDSTSNSKITPTAGTLSSPLPIIGDDGNGTSYLGTWGYSMTSSAVTGTFTGLNSTPTIIKQSSTASASGGDQFPVYYGVSVTPTLEPGNYTMAKDPNNSNNPGTIVYQLTMPVECQTYSIKYDGNGDTGSTKMSNQEIPSNATELDLWPSNYSRAGYGFAGWSLTQLNPDSANAATELANAVSNGKVYGPMETITIDSTFTANANQDKEITLYAVWVKSAGDIQSWQGCSSMTNGQVTALKDTRDNNVYAVAKLADGNCWMIENLRLGGNSPITLTSANSNVTSNFTLSATTDPTQTAWCTSTDANCYNQSMLNSTNTTNPASDMTTSSLASSDNTGIYSLGNYYNWYSATAGTGTYSTSTNNTSVASSICPAGWRLSTGGQNTVTSGQNGDFYVLTTTLMGEAPNNANNGYAYYNGTVNGVDVGAKASKLLRSYPNNYIYSGYVYDSSLDDRGSYANVWSSTASSSNYAYNLYFFSSYVRPGTNYAHKYYGFSVRCVADKTASPGKIMYHENGANSPTGMWEQAVSGTTATLWPSNFQHTGGDYGFAGWNTKKDGTGTSYGPMEDITLPSNFATNGLNLYAMWIPSAGNIQNWNGCSSLAQGAVTALTDTRDYNVYAVAKLADGKCWMIENLRLGDTRPINLTTANSALSANLTLPASINTFTTTNYTSIEMNAKNTTSSTTNMDGTNTEVYSYGNYYSWPAAIGSTTTYSTNNQSVSTSICPSGWHLPKGGDNQNTANNEFLGLSVALTGAQPANYSSLAQPSYTGNPEGTNASNLHRKYPNNFLYSGALTRPSFNGRGYYGYYWSSTVDTYTSSYYLLFGSSYVYPGTFNSNKYYGYSVRCVR